MFAMDLTKGTNRLTLRDHQVEGVDELFKYLERDDCSPCLVAATGAGKSLINAEVIERLIMQDASSRIICLTHVQELVEQNYQELLGQWPTAPAGINAAKLNSRDVQSPIIFAMIQSIFKSAPYVGKVDYIIIDECHLVPSKGNGMYRRFIDECKRFNKKLKVIGLSATPYRLNDGFLDEGNDRIFTELIQLKSLQMPYLIEHGYLTPLSTPSIETKIDKTKLKPSSTGDYLQASIDAACNVPSVTINACKELVEIGKDRNSWLLFASSIKHAENLKHHLKEEYGIESGIVTGKTAKKERQKIVEDFRSGKLRVFINLYVAMIGFNVKRVDLIAAFGATKSASRYVQLCGRGMRNHESKLDCLFFDFAGLIDIHGPVDEVQGKSKKKGNGEGEAPIKICPQCESSMLAASRECPDCGYLFLNFEEVNHNETASRKSVISSLPEGHKIIDVSRVEYREHISQKGNRSIRVDYFGKNKKPSSTEFVPFGMGGKMDQILFNWWGKRTDCSLPGDIRSAISLLWHYSAVKTPEQIMVKKDGKYNKIVGIKF